MLLLYITEPTMVYCNILNLEKQDLETCGNLFKSKKSQEKVNFQSHGAITYFILGC